MQDTNAAGSSGSQDQLIDYSFLWEGDLYIFIHLIF